MALGRVLFWNERRDQRLVGRAAKGLRDAGDERQRQDVPDADGSGEDERRQREGRGHLHALRHEQQVPPVAAIGDDAADEREEQDRELRRRNESRPRKNAEAVPVSVTISQACATFCIQVPMLERRAPNQSRRKSR